MKQIKYISENKNHTAVNIGSLDELSEYSFIHPKTGQEVRGKVFIKEATKATGTEISFTALPPHTEGLRLRVCGDCAIPRTRQ